MSTRTDVAQPRLGIGGWLRWTWRQLTSMRTALFLLLLLAIGAIPGSTFPQRSIDPARTSQWIADHPTAGPVLDRLGLRSNPGAGAGPVGTVLMAGATNEMQALRDATAGHRRIRLGELGEPHFAVAQCDRGAVVCGVFIE